MIQFLDFPIHAADSPGIPAEYVAPETPGGRLPLKAETTGVIQTHPFPETLTDRAQFHTDEVVWDEPDREIRSRPRAPPKAAFVKLAKKKMNCPAMRTSLREWR
jgi:hypothetical protein